MKEEGATVEIRKCLSTCKTTGALPTHYVEAEIDVHSIAALSGADVGFEGFSSPNNSPMHSPKYHLMQHTEDTKEVTIHYPQAQKCTEATGVEMQMELPKEQQRSSLNSVRGSAVIEADVELPNATPAKRRKHNLNEYETTAAPLDDFVNTSNLQTSPDQMASSEMCTRLKRNSKYQLRCSTETTSDFPVSSPSNPQAVDGKRFQRSTFQKNTLPANAFERNLALLTVQKPQMTLEEKINAWQCDMELSDVEDVNNFDDLFKEHEKLKRTVLYTAKDIDRKASGAEYDFVEFRAKVIENIRAAATVARNSEDKLHMGKPITSFSSQRRLRTAIESENKKRLHIERTGGKNSTTTTVSSSSENEALYIAGTKQKQKKYNPVQKVSLQKGNTYEKMLRRDGCGKESQHDSNLKVSNCKSTEIPSSNCLHTDMIRKKSLSPNFIRFPTYDDSFLNPRCLNCEIGRSNTNSQCFIQMRQDFSTEKKALHLHQKKNELFKTPIVPQRYTQVPTSTTVNNNKESVAKSKDNLESTGVSLTSSPEEIVLDVPVSPTATAAFHQQHEFCNYLGLTGMSTANAVANAVAELANCNLARRSLRVRQLQQQEKRDKEQQVKNQPIKDDNIMHSLKPESDLPCNQKYNKDKCNEMDIQSKSSLYGSKLHNNTSKAPAESLTKDNIVSPKKKPEIKIICHISADADKIKMERKINYANEAVAPSQESSICRLNPDADSSSNYTSTCPRSSISESDAINDRCDIRTLKQNATTKEVQINCNSSKNSKYSSNIKNSPLTTPKKTILLPKKLEESEIIKQKLHNKFQTFLEASRKMKPSIYIVQTLNSADGKQHHNKNKEGINVSTMEVSKQPTIFCVEQHHSICQDDRKLRLIGDEKSPSPKSLSTKRMKKERLRKFLAQSAWHNRHQRALRKRKILLVRTIKRIAEINNAVKKVDKSVATEMEPSLATLNITPEKSIQMISNSTTFPNGDQLNEERGDVRQSLHRKVVKNDNSEKRLLQKRGTQSNRYHMMINGKQKAKQGNKKTIERSIPSPADTSSGSKDLNTPTNEIVLKALNKNVSLNKFHDNETVVVSSTTNSYDEAALLKMNCSQLSLEQKEIPTNTSHVILTKDHNTEHATSHNRIHYLNSPTKALSSPIKIENGRVDYVYYEMDVLIVVQELSISFWKYFKLITVLAAPQYNCQLSRKNIANKMSQLQLEPSSPTTTVAGDNTTVVGNKSEWVPLGECRRLINDIEISTSYANRICSHNSIPIYMEMRCRMVPRDRRECNLLSMYINVYYYNDDEMLAKMHSIQLDAVQSIPSEVVYTTLTESRYFVMTWPQENIIGKTCSGLCKYSLTPNMDTLASIREFKNMRHSIRYLECSSDDKLIGFGDTQVTIWNHRSGDVLLNYDLDVELGRNLGSIYYPSLEMGQNSMLLLFQYMQNDVKGVETPPELLVIACSISHINPSHRILSRYNLPYPAFRFLNNATNSGEHLVITAQNDEEIWISCADAKTMTHVAAQGTRRFYSRGRTQLIELTNETLTVDSFANHVLKLAANTDIKSAVNNSGICNSV